LQAETMCFQLPTSRAISLCVNATIQPQSPTPQVQDQKCARSVLSHLANVRIV
jgi:hypothetical protein